MKVKKESIYKEKKAKSEDIADLDSQRHKGNFTVDLNSQRHRKKIEGYIKNGIPASDAKHGHHVTLQVKVHPIAADILEDIKEKTGRKYWKNQSDLLRSIISVGSYITLQVLKSPEGKKSFQKEFELIEFIHMINKRKRNNELAVEVRKAIKETNRDPFDIDSYINEIKNLLDKE